MVSVPALRTIEAAAPPPLRGRGCDMVLVLVPPLRTMDESCSSCVQKPAFGYIRPRTAFTSEKASANDIFSVCMRCAMTSAGAREMPF